MALLARRQGSYRRYAIISHASRVNDRASMLGTPVRAPPSDFIAAWGPVGDKNQ